MNDHDHGVNLDWVVKSTSPWWHRGAATAAMLLLVNTILLTWRNDVNWALLSVSFALMCLCASIDMAQDK